jgi:hypothetical protein
MDYIESRREAAERLVHYAAAQSCGVALFRSEHDVFENGMRCIDLWLEGDNFGYHISGEIVKLPSQFAESKSSFRGVWDEAGSVEDLDQAFHLLRAWLIDAKEVDDLPHRTIDRCMI